MQTADRQLAGERGDSEFMRKTEEKRWLLEKGRRYEKDVREISLEVTFYSAWLHGSRRQNLFTVIIIQF